MQTAFATWAKRRCRSDTLVVGVELSRSSAAQSPNGDRKAVRHGGDLMVLEHLRNVDVAIDVPLRIGDTRRLPPPSVRAASSGPPPPGRRAGPSARFAYIPAVGTVHTAAAVSI